MGRTNHPGVRTGAQLAIAFAAAMAFAQIAWPQSPPATAGQAEREPPPRAYEDCRGKKAGDIVTHQTRDGAVAAICEQSPRGLVARPIRSPAGSGGEQGTGAPPPGSPPARGPAPHASSGGGSQTAPRYSLEQALSDKAQLNTIAFDGLAFLTGDFAADTFLPPGKVSDYFGFQYMRDIDAAQAGHNTSFLTRIAHNVLAILSDAQRARLLQLARDQQDNIKRFAEMRFPLIKAFRRNLEGDIPAGSGGLSKAAVVKLSADLYELDGLLAYERARVMGEVIRSLDDRQKSALARLKFGDSSTWPDAPPPDKRGMSHEIDVAVMTYASEMFSWHAGSLAADTYFCPERHGMYFGGFGMKTAPAMGKRDYAISTSLTGDSGEAFLAALTPSQRGLITGLLELQRKDLSEIPAVRRAIAEELRRFQRGETAGEATVLALSRRYGELDGEMSYLYATAFAKVGRDLSDRQKAGLSNLRAASPADPKGPFLYSQPIAMPRLENTDWLFGVGR